MVAVSRRTTEPSPTNPVPIMRVPAPRRRCRWTSSPRSSSGMSEPRTTTWARSFASRRPDLRSIAITSGGRANRMASAASIASTRMEPATAAPGSLGVRRSSTFAGVEDPLDETDRWYPLPGYSGFRKAGVAIGKDGAHTASGVWSIAPPAKQYSEVTLGTVARGGGGPVVRIDRTNNGQTGWLLFLAPENLSLSGIYKMNPDGSFTGVRLFTPAIVSGDKWRLTADGNTLEAFRNA